MSVNKGTIMSALAAVDDPELPISIVQLGIVKEVDIDDQGQVHIIVTPTFCGCPALAVIEQRIREAVSSIAGVSSVCVTWLFEPDWDIDAIEEEGINALKAFGIAVPSPTRPLLCPYCDSPETVRESAFGPTLCRSLYYCRSCHNPFEVMKPLGTCRRSAKHGSMGHLEGGYVQDSR